MNGEGSAWSLGDTRLSYSRGSLFKAWLMFAHPVKVLINNITAIIRFI